MNLKCGHECFTWVNFMLIRFVCLLMKRVVTQAGNIPENSSSKAVSWFVSMGHLVMTGPGSVTTLSPANSLANNNCTSVTGKVAARPTIRFPVTSSESSLTLCNG